jgi:hypothetical protein
MLQTGQPREITKVIKTLLSVSGLLHPLNFSSTAETKCNIRYLCILPTRRISRCHSGDYGE